MGERWNTRRTEIVPKHREYSTRFAKNMRLYLIVNLLRNRRRDFGGATGSWRQLLMMRGGVINIAVLTADLTHPSCLALWRKYYSSDFHPIRQPTHLYELNRPRFPSCLLDFVQFFCCRPLIAALIKEAERFGIGNRGKFLRFTRADKSNSPLHVDALLFSSFCPDSWRLCCRWWWRLSGCYFRLYVFTIERVARKLTRPRFTGKSESS